MVEEYNNFKLSQRWDNVAYTNQLRGLLPKGLAWVFDKFLLYSIIQDVLSGDGWQDIYTGIDAVQDAIRTTASGHLLTRLLSCFADEMANAESEAWRLINQTDPGVATDTLEDWERVLGLPEDCFADQVLTVDERQRQAHAKLFSKYEVTDLDFYSDYAAELGFDIIVVQIPVEYSPRIMGVARMNVERMGGRGGFSILQVIIVSGDSDAALLKCAFSKVKQAHVVINYVGPDFVGPELFLDGDMEDTGPDVIVDGDMEVTGPDVIVDGDMEVTGPDVIVDGDMEVTGPDVILDGDMETTGPDVIVDGDMEASGIGAWTVGAGATVTKQAGTPHGGNQCLRVLRNAANSYAAQTILTIGKTYRAKGWARGDGTAYPEVRDTGTILWTGTTSTSWQYFNVVFVAATTLFELYGTITGFYAEYDDVEVIDETVACASYTPVNSALLSKQEDPYEGVQCLRVEYGGVANPWAVQSILTISKTYRIKGVARSDGATGGWIYNGATPIFQIALLTSWQEYDIVFVATHAELRFRNTSGTGYVEFDDVEVIDETVACAAWTIYANALLSKQEDSYEGVQCLRAEYNGTNYPGASQTLLTIAKTYRLKGVARSSGVGAPRIAYGPAVWTGTSSTSWQPFDIVFVATGTVITFYSTSAGVGQYVEFDDVEVIDETVACAAWAIPGTTLGSKQEDPHGGAQCLRLEQTGVGVAAQGFQTVLTIGKTYRVKGWARGDGVIAPRIYDAGVGYIWIGTTSTSWQPFDLVWVAGHGNVTLRSAAGIGGIGDYIEYDDVEVIDETVACAAWTAYDGAILSKQEDAYEAAQCIRCEDSTGNSFGTAGQLILTVGKTYTAKGWGRSNGTAIPKFYNAGTILVSGTSSTSWQYLQVTFVAAATSRFSLVSTGQAYGFCEFDDVEVIDETVACAAWQASGSALLSKQEDAYEGVQCLRVEYGGALNPDAIQSILTVAKTYRVKGWGRGDGTGVPRVYSSGPGTLWLGTSSTAWQYFDVVFVAGHTQILLTCNINVAGFAEFDAVFVIDETVSCAAWTAGADTILSKQNDAYEGVQCLRVEQEVALTTAIASQTILAVGEIYRIKGWARSNGVLIPQTKDGSGVGIWTGTISTDWQEIDVVFISGSLVYQLESLTGYGGVGDYVEFDIVSIKAEF